MYTLQILARHTDKEEILNVLKLLIEEARLTNEFDYELEAVSGLEMIFELTHEPLTDLAKHSV